MIATVAVDSESSFSAKDDSDVKEYIKNSNVEICSIVFEAKRDRRPWYRCMASKNMKRCCVLIFILMNTHE